LYSSKTKLSILHVVLSIGETNAAYNEHCLPLAETRQIAICTYFRSDTVPPANICFFPGDGSVRGFLHRLHAALEVRAYDVIHIHSPHLGVLFLLATSLGRDRRFAGSALVTVHDSYPNYKLRNRLLFLPVFARFPKVICCSQSSFESFPAFYKRLAGDRLGAVPNGLDIARVDHIVQEARDTLPARTADFTAVAISRLINIKNPFTLLSAFEQSREQNSRLIYIGDGTLREALLTKSRQAGIERQVTFTGLIRRDEVFEHLLNADLFLSCSRGEGLPVSVLEAMACSCPVVLSDIPPHREIAEGLDFIPLVQPDDVAGFAREIRRFAEMTGAQRSAIGRQCRERVEERFSLEAMHAGYEKVYRQIIERRTG
jgi:glycosyltransferase involved in cell wall biosynthesis